MKKTITLCDRCMKEINPLHHNNQWIEPRFSSDRREVVDYWECCLECQSKHKDEFELDVKKYLSFPNKNQRS